MKLSTINYFSVLLIIGVLKVNCINLNSIRRSENEKEYNLNEKLLISTSNSNSDNSNSINTKEIKPKINPSSITILKQKNNLDESNLPNSNFRGTYTYTYTYNLFEEVETDGNKTVKLRTLIQIYLQFFVLFSLIAFHKWHEEMYKMKTLYIENKYSNFIDLTDESFKNKDPSEFEDKYIFCSGDPSIKSSAQDCIFNYNYNKQYAKIERRVEVMNIITKKWTKLGHIKKKDDTFTADLDYDEFDINFIGDEYMEVSFGGDIFTFPRIITSVFLGQVSVYYNIFI